MPSTTTARIYITLIVLAGAATFGMGLLHPTLTHPVRLLALLVVSVISSRLKVMLPGMKANMAVSLPFLLLASAQDHLYPAVVIAAAATVAQSIGKQRGSTKILQTVFNASAVVLATAAAYGVQHQSRFGSAHSVLLLLIGAAAYFLVNTVLVAGVVALTGGQSAGRAWSSIFALTYVYYVLSAGIGAVILGFGIRQSVLLLSLLVMYGAYRSFQLYFDTMSSILLPQIAVAGD